MSADLTKLAPPQELTDSEKNTIFEHFLRRLASYRNTHLLYSRNEQILSSSSSSAPPSSSAHSGAFSREIQAWAQALLENAWHACDDNDQANNSKPKCPVLDPYTETSVSHLPPMPDSPEAVDKLLTTILFLHITIQKGYSARTRTFLYKFSPTGGKGIDEMAIVKALKNPEQAVKEAEKKRGQSTEKVKEEHARKTSALRKAGIGLGAVAGGVLIGVTGGLAAPLVGAGVSAVFGFLGVGGTAAGMLASGLAGSSVVCGALFGAYGARSTASMVSRHMQEIRDLAVLPVVGTNGETIPHSKESHEETLAVRVCISGWLKTEEDVTQPWTVFDSRVETFALRWEVQALENLSSALFTLVKQKLMGKLKAEILKRTVLASLMSSLSPLVYLQLGKIVDNPWSNARALAIKLGHILASLLLERAFGARPITLSGYSLGSLAILVALSDLAERPPHETVHLVEDVFLMGTPASTDAKLWSRARRVVGGRLVNAYTRSDYILAILARASDISSAQGGWEVAGLGPVNVQGVENVDCGSRNKDIDPEDTETTDNKGQRGVGVDGHLQWPGLVGCALLECGAPGVVEIKAEQQKKNAGSKIEREMQEAEAEAQSMAKHTSLSEDENKAVQETVGQAQSKDRTM